MTLFMATVCVRMVALSQKFKIIIFKSVKPLFYTPERNQWLRRNFIASRNLYVSFSLSCMAADEICFVSYAACHDPNPLHRILSSSQINDRYTPRRCVPILPSSVLSGDGC